MALCSWQCVVSVMIKCENVFCEHSKKQANTHNHKIAFQLAAEEDCTGNTVVISRYLQ